MRLLPEPSFQHVLLVRLEQSVPGPTAVDGAALVGALSRLGARQVVFPADAGMAVSSGDGATVLAGRHARPDHPGQPKAGWILIDPPVGNVVGWGAVILPPLEAGVLRRMPTTVPVDGAPVPTLPYAAARAAGASGLPSPGETFLPRFPRSLASLPSVDAGRVLEERVPAELVAGRSVILAPAADPRLPGFATPAAAHTAALQLPELHAVALDALLSGRAVRELGPLASFLLVLVAALGGSALYLRLGPRHWPWAALGVTAAILLASYAALRWADLLLPIAMLLVSQVLLSLALWRWREVAEDRALRQMRRELSARLRKVAAPAFEEEAAAGSGTWQAAAMASRLLGLRRSVFLVPRLASAGAPMLEQAAGIGASLADIPPGQRDPSAPPFSLAAREGGPVAVERGFLASAEEGEEVYLAPLRSRATEGEGMTTAFWAFALPRGEAQRVPALLGAIRAAAEGLERPTAMPGSLGTGVKRLDVELWRDVDRLMLRAATLAGVLEEVSTAAVVFDPLGRVLHQNARMAAVAEMAGLPVGAGLAPPDLIAALGGLPQDQAARLVRRVLLERVPVELNAARLLGGRRHLLRLTVPAGEAEGEAAAPALLCELVDVTEPLRLAEIQRGFAEHIGMKLRNEIEAIQLGAGLLEDLRLPEASRPRALARLRAALEAMRTTIATVESFMAFEIGDQVLQAYPVDALAALRLVVTEATRAAARRPGLRIELTAPEIADLALAAPGALEAALRAMLLLLVEDARGGGTISITMEEGAAVVVIRCANEGFGMPNARLQAVLSGEEAPGSAELGALREAARAASGWGGILAGEASPGEGFCLTLTLKKLF